jgi:hypothetical protein
MVNESIKSGRGVFFESFKSKSKKIKQEPYPGEKLILLSNH